MTTFRVQKSSSPTLKPARARRPARPNVKGIVAQPKPLAQTVAQPGRASQGGITKVNLATQLHDLFGYSNSTFTEKKQALENELNANKTRIERINQREQNATQSEFKKTHGYWDPRSAPRPTYETEPNLFTGSNNQPKQELFLYDMATAAAVKALNTQENQTGVGKDGPSDPAIGELLAARDEMVANTTPGNGEKVKTLTDALKAQPTG